jgi:hypothetical protein
VSGAAAVASSSSSSGGGGGGSQPAAAAGVSEGLRAANKALTDKIKAALDGPSYAHFREDSGAFMQGKLSAGQCRGRVLTVQASRVGLAACFKELHECAMIAMFH